MIGQTMINVKASGARTRISTFCAGVFLFLLVVEFGVVGGVLVASVLFVRRVAHFVSVTRVLGEARDAVTYVVEGELFFASSNDLTTLVAYSSDPSRVAADLSGSHVWDASTVAALDAIETKYQALGKTVEILGMNESSQRMRGRLTGEFQ